jgi:hypothetical protein
MEAATYVQPYLLVVKQIPQINLQYIAINLLDVLSSNILVGIISQTDICGHMLHPDSRYRSNLSIHVYRVLLVSISLIDGAFVTNTRYSGTNRVKMQFFKCKNKNTLTCIFLDIKCNKIILVFPYPCVY